MAGNSAAVAEMEECAALMRDSGLTVIASSGWKDRGVSSSVNFWAVLEHHTANPNDNDGILINGRSDLPGPLCNWALHEYGDWVLIASGRANHAGEGTLPSSESYGVEATGPQNYPDTYGPDAFPNNYDSYVIGTACILAVMGGDESDVFGHKETARPLGRKIDPYFDMGQFRGAVESGETEGDGFLSAEAERQVNEIYTGMVVPGTKTVTESFEKLFNRVKVVEDAIGVPGTTTPQQSFEIVYRRIQRLEDGIDAICEHLGIPFEQVDTSTITG
jgi:N-acetylmuramoyl-L-alanine amidase